jgi:hypothetical protein
MRGLKVTLVLTYIVIIILLLLKCKGCEYQHGLGRDTVIIDTIHRDTVIVEIKEKFNADVVMCIDCTMSMSSIIGTIKNNAMNFYSDLKQKCRAQGKQVLSLRIKVIAFRDRCDMLPFEVSNFFTMPEQEGQFKTFVSGLQDIGGGDDYELGYDALAMALQSDWSTVEDSRRVVILWTDEGSRPLWGMTSTFGHYEQMKSYWNNDFGGNSKRLILFAPSSPSWTQIDDEWDNSVRHDVGIGRGLTDIDYDEIIKTLTEII